MKHNIYSILVVFLLTISLAGCRQAYNNASYTDNNSLIDSTTVADTDSIGTSSDTSISQHIEKNSISNPSTTHKENSNPSPSLVNENIDEPTNNDDSYDTSQANDADNTDVQDFSPILDDKQVTICMVGDILLHDGVNRSARRDDGSYDYNAIFKNVSDKISSYDLAIVNQEVIIGGADLGITGYPSFNAPFEIGDALEKAGFDVVLHATNHALDRGSKGLKNCINYWQENHPDMTILGIHESQESQNEIFVTEIKGIRIAILNYTYGTNGIPLPSDMPFGVDLLSENRLKQDISKAKEMADFVIVCPHWGTEYHLNPDKSQENWTKMMFEAGADLVIGTHPHVIEPIEMITSEESDRQMLVYYSLGNFVNWTSGYGDGIANRVIGGMADVTITFNKENKATISNYGVTALVTDLRPMLDGVTTYKLSDYNEELASQNAVISQAKDFSYEYCINLCNEVWGDLWK